MSKPNEPQPRPQPQKPNNSFNTDERGAPPPKYSIPTPPPKSSPKK